MTFLPIVDRELRVAARRSGTFWSRQGVALGAILIGACIFVVNFGAPPAVVGKYIFMGLAILSFVYCLFSGRRSTADCLSEEKREGTLGLLFLTDLKGYDVVLGKLVATSVNAFYGLLAVFPVLAIPLLMGGITSGEFWRVVLVLVVTFLFSLAIGMFSSAVNRDLRQTMALNFALLLIFTLALPACAGIYAALFSAGNQFFQELCLTSPGYALILSSDLTYKTNPSYFWISVAIIHGLTWLLLILAMRIVPRSWQDRPPPPTRAFKTRWRAFWHGWSYGRAGKSAAYRKQLLDINAFYWHAARARLKPIHVWLVMGLIGCWWVGGRIYAGNVWLDEPIRIALALMLNTTLKLWLIIESTQRLAEDKKIGAMELLLSTPLEVSDIVRGQLLALRRQFLYPFIAVLLLEFYLMFNAEGFARGQSHPMSFIWLAGIFMLVADAITLPWVGMARALTAKSHHHAIISTLLRIILLPWIGYGLLLAIVGLWSALTSMLPGGGWEPGWQFLLSWWVGLGILADVVFGLSARRQVFERMRSTALERYVPPRTPRESWFARRKKTTAQRASIPRPAITLSPIGGEGQGEGSAQKNPKLAPRKPSKFLRWAFALVLVCVCAGYFLRSRPPNFPPPVVVPMNLNSGSLRVFPGTSGALFILPDGSLWRWGQTGVLPQAQLPERYGNGQNWVKAETAYNDCVALRSDGTIWAQRPENQPAGNSTGELNQIDPGHDWADITTRGDFSFAIKKDGTLWSWGRRGRGPFGGVQNLIQTNITQIGADHDWTALSAEDYSIIALKRNGTLWTWGTIFASMAPGGMMYAPPQIFPIPTQFCSDTNWLGFESGFRLMVRNQAGELWQPFVGPAGATSGAAANCRLIATNALPHHVAFAYVGDPRMYEIRTDGTLWQKDFTANASPFDEPGEWHQAGKRRDWVSLWSSGGTAYGLTADGTLWTWGIDPTLDIPPDFLTKLKLLRARLSMLASSRRPMGGMAQIPGFHAEPRPLLRSATGN